METGEGSIRLEPADFTDHLKTFAIGYINVQENEIEFPGRHNLKGVGEIVGFPRANCREEVAYNEKGCQPYDGMVFNK